MRREVNEITDAVKRWMEKGKPEKFSAWLEEFYKRDHALFIAFAPLEQPRIALGIIVENGESGSKAAAPIARALFDAYFRITAEDGNAPG